MFPLRSPKEKLYKLVLIFLLHTTRKETTQVYVVHLQVAPKPPPKKLMTVQLTTESQFPYSIMRTLHE